VADERRVAAAHNVVGPAVLGVAGSERLDEARFRRLTLVRAGPGLGTTIDLRCAAAADLPFEDDTFEVTVSFNTVQFWPDLNAGLREIRRVTRPGGKVLISWHGGTAPTRVQRRLVLDDAELAGLASAIGEHIGEHIGDVGQQHLAQSELFTAVVRAGAR